MIYSMKFYGSISTLTLSTFNEKPAPHVVREKSSVRDTYLRRPSQSGKCRSEGE